MRIIYIYIGFMFLISGVGYSKDFLLADVLDNNIKIRTSFSGAKIFLYGSIDPNLYDKVDVLVLVRGPERNFKVRKKYKKFGVWITGFDEIIFKNVPSYYAISTSAQLSGTIYDNLFIEKEIGWKNIKFIQSNNMNGGTESEFFQGLGQNLIKKGLFSYNKLNIEIVNRGLFKVAFNMPELTPTGIYKINTFLLGRDGLLVAEWENSVEVSKEGMAAKLYDFSQENSLLYGFFAALAALVAGFLASELFRRI